MQIDLRPHVGKNVATKREIDLGQDRVFVDGELYGYVGRKPDAPILLIYADVPADTKDAIRAAVVAKYGGQAATIAEPVMVPEEAIDSDGEFDED